LILLSLIFFILLVHPHISSSFPTRRSSDLRPLRAFFIDEWHASPGTAIPGARRIGHGTNNKGQAQGEPVMSASTTQAVAPGDTRDRKSTRLNSSHVKISYAVFCLKKKKGRA